MTQTRTLLLFGLAGFALIIAIWTRPSQDDYVSKADTQSAQAQSIHLDRSLVETVPLEKPAADPLAAEPSPVLEPSVSPMNDIMQKPDKRFGVFSDEDMAELERWHEQRGYLNPGRSEDDYTYYDDDTLRILAENGDPKAMLLYGRRAWANNKDYEAAKEALVNATVHGYTSSLNELGGINHNLYEKEAKEGQARVARDYLINAFAWWEVGMMRGDKTLYWSQKHYAPREQPFTDEEKSAIAQRANDIYAHLSEQRYNQGLAEFDNSTPKVIDEVFSHLMEDQEDQ